MSVCRLRRALLPVGLVLGLVACGETAEHDGQVPLGGSIVIFPPSLPVVTVKGGAVGTPGCGDPFPPFIFEKKLVISTFDAGGLPRGNVDIDVFLDFVSVGVTALGDDLNGNGSVVGPADTGELFATGAFSTRTDDFGNRTLFIVLNVNEGCVYSGSLTVSSGSVVKDMPFDVAN